MGFFQSEAGLSRLDRGRPQERCPEHNPSDDGERKPDPFRTHLRQAEEEERHRHQRHDGDVSVALAIPPPVVIGGLVLQGEESVDFHVGGLEVAGPGRLPGRLGA